MLTLMTALDVVLTAACEVWWYILEPSLQFPSSLSLRTNKFNDIIILTTEFCKKQIIRKLEPEVI
jgi:hypothetical protein